MTIRSILELLAEADANLPDNTTQLIAPSDIRNLIKDFLDTIAPAYGAIACTSSVETLSATPVAIAPFTAVRSVTAGFYTANLTNGSVTHSRQGAPGCTDFILVTGDVEGPNGDLVTVELFKNGAPTGFRSTVALGGAGRPVSFNLSALLYSDNDPVFDVRVSGDAGDKTFTNVGLLCQNQPVRSFV